MFMRIGKFGYLNNYLPYYWIERCKKARIIEGSPKVLAEKIEKREIDYAPIPSFHYLKNKDKLRHYNFCIASEGEVLSVLIVSNGKNLNDKIAVTNESITSVNLLKIILNEMGLNCKLFFVNEKNVDNLLKYCNSALVIGDEAVKARLKYNVIMDLGKVWYVLTGYPMVFGISASLKEVDAMNCDELIMKSIDWGFKNFDEIVMEAEREFNISKDFLAKYFKTLIYRLGHKEKKGLKIFEEYCIDNKLL